MVDEIGDPIAVPNICAYHKEYNFINCMKNNRWMKFEVRIWFNMYK